MRDTYTNESNWLIFSSYRGKKKETDSIIGRWNWGMVVGGMKNAFGIRDL